MRSSRERRVFYQAVSCRSALNHVRARFPFRWSLNPYTSCAHRCAFCYARAYARRADRPSDNRYGHVVAAKINVADVLGRELARPRWAGEQVAIGTATDPYQPAEGRYRLTRACIERLADRANPFSITTRGPLVVRDTELLAAASRVAEVSVAFSVPTLDEKIWRATEPGTAPPRQRLRALAKLTAAGVRAGVFVAPILPGLSDRPELLEQVVVAAAEAGADFVWMEMLNLKPGTREHFLSVLTEAFPDRVPLYRRLYAGRIYLPGSMAAPLRAELDRLRRRHEIGARGRARRFSPPSKRTAAGQRPAQLRLLV